MKPSYRLRYAPDNASLVIRLALEALQQPFDTTLVDRASQGQKLATYLALNPNGLIPVLETPDGAIFETGAILLWLADRHGALAPAPDSTERADFLKWLFFLSNTLHPALRCTFYPGQYVGEDAAAQDALRRHMQGEITRHYDVVSQEAGRDHMWFDGTEPSIFDFYLCCLLRWSALYPVGHTGWFRLEGFPALHRLACRLEHCPAVSAAIYAEGLGATPFSAPSYATPPEGSAT
jgi:glutathione S-transferase